MLKKVLLGMVILSAVSMAEGTNIYLRAGANVWEKFDVLKYDGQKISNEKTDEFSYEIAAEITKEIYQNIELGVGIAYQDHGNPKDKSVFGEKYKMPGYTSVPVYITGKYNIPTDFHNIKPYIKMDLGYSFNDKNRDAGVVIYGGERKLSTKIEDGVYFGIGAGLEYNNFTADIMYKITKAEMETSTGRSKQKYDLDYSRVTLAIGYKFNY